MEFNFAEREVFLVVFGLIVLGFYFYVFGNFFQSNSWFIFCIVYVTYFVLYDGYRRLKKVEDNIRIIETKERRIDFWN